MTLFLYNQPHAQIVKFSIIKHGSMEKQKYCIVYGKINTLQKTCNDPYP